MSRQLITILPVLTAASLPPLGTVAVDLDIHTSNQPQPAAPDCTQTEKPQPAADGLFPAAWEATFAVASILIVLGLNKYHKKKGRGAKKANEKLTKKTQLSNYQEPAAPVQDVKQIIAPRFPKVVVQPKKLSPEELKQDEDRLRNSELLHALARKGDVFRATKTLQHLEQTYGTVQLSDYTCVITMCSKAGDASSARQWLRRVQEVGLSPNNICFNAVINAYAKHGNMQQALGLADEMKSIGVDFDTVTYNTIIDAWARAGDAESSQMWMRKMLDTGVRASVVSFGSVMRACAQAGLHEELDVWFKEAENLGIELNMICYSAVINSFVKKDDLVTASTWLTCMIKRGVTASLQCYMGLVNALLGKNDIAFAVSIFEELIEAKVELDAGMYNSLVCVSANSGQSEVAMKWAENALACGHQLSRSSETALVASNLRVPLSTDASVQARIAQTIEIPDETLMGEDKQSISKTAGRRACVGRRFTGTIKEFISCKFGYILCEETYAIFKRDVFLCCQDNPEQLAKGQKVTFTLQIDRQRGLPRASEVRTFQPSH